MSQSVTSEVASAMVGGMFSASALYPLEVLKTRMQAESKPSSSSRDEVDEPNEQEGTESSNSTAADQKKLKAEYAHAASEGMGAYATLMYNNEGGVAPFYSGVVTSAVQSATEKALYFFAYTFLKNG